MAKKLHLGFKETQAKIAKKQGINMKAAGAILADSARRSSPAAKKLNPALLNVKGKPKKYVEGGKTGAQLKAEGMAMKAKGRQMKGEGMAAKVVGTMQKNMNTAKPVNKTVDAVMNVVGMVASPSGPAKAAQAISKLVKAGNAFKTVAKSKAAARIATNASIKTGIKTTNPVARKLGEAAVKQDKKIQAIRKGKEIIKRTGKEAINPQTKLKFK